MSFEGILNQIFQPYFYYSLLFLIVSFVCIKVLVRFFPFIGPRVKSILYLIPLAIPLIVMLVFMPSTTIGTGANHVNSGLVYANQAANGLFSAKFYSSLASSDSIFFLSVAAPSVAGMICLLGLFLSGVFVLSMILADDRIAKKNPAHNFPIKR